ncbi:hypothetical protein [Psychrilyobacter sp.]
MIMIILQSIAITTLLYVSYRCLCALNEKKAEMEKEERDGQ